MVGMREGFDTGMILKSCARTLETFQGVEVPFYELVKLQGDIEQFDTCIIPPVICENWKPLLRESKALLKGSSNCGEQAEAG